MHTRTLSSMRVLLVAAAVVVITPSQSDARPGEIIGVFCTTAEGTHAAEGPPAVPRRRERAAVREFRFPDGQRVARLRTVQEEPGHLVHELTVTPSSGVKTMGVRLRAEPEEFFCGLFERVVDGGQGESWKPGMTEALDLRGLKIDMFVKPTVALYAPFYVSTGGYGVCVEGDWPGRYDMAATDPAEIRFEFEGPVLTFHVFRADTPMEILRMYAGVVGTTILPPRWVFRPWRWRDEHKNPAEFFDGTAYTGPYNAQLVEDILMMDALDIPCGVYWVDRPWAVGSMGYCDFKWDLDRLPNPEKMIRWLDERDVRFLLWIAPWVLGDMKAEGDALGYFLPSDPAKERGLVDFTNRDAVAWWQGYLDRVIDVGVAGFKLDRAEEIVPSSPDVLTHSGMTTREMHNAYPRMYAEAAHDALRRVRGDDFVIMPRAAYTGSQRYAAFWAGDTAGTEWGLRSAIIGAQRAAVLGFAVWGSDTGGYHQGSNRETTARWLAFSAFCPLMEVGPTANRGLWNAPWEPGYDAELLAVWSLYARVHDRIGDYLYDCAERANATGEPIVRPLFVQFPNDPECPTWWDEYMLGDDILVCPVWRSGAVGRTVYLPDGEWTSPWLPGMRLLGPAEFEVACALHSIPVFVRAGAAVDLGDLQSAYDEALTRTRQVPNMAELAEKAGLN